jgi:thiol-disulfide isomerase/thioredoxin
MNKFIILLLLFNISNAKELSVTEILEKADSARKEIHSIKYSDEYEFRNNQGEYYKHTSIKILNYSDSTNVKFLIERPDKSFISFHDGQTFELFFDQKKFKYSSKINENNISLSTAKNIFSKYGKPVIKDSEKKSDTMYYDRIEIIDGTETYRINSKKSYSNYGMKANIIYNIDTKTYLVKRSFIENITHDIDTHSYRNTYTILDINMDVPDSIFELSPPEGFKIIDLDSSRLANQKSKKKMIEIGKQMPDWEFKSTDSTLYKSSDFRGKHILLNFWGSWCGACKVFMPFLEKVHQKYPKDKLEVWGLTAKERDKKPDHDKIIKRYKASFPTMVYGDKLADELGVRSYPTTFLINPDGKIINIWKGADESLESDMSKFLK